MKQFFLSLINVDNPNSSKRFAGLTVLFTTIGLTIAATIKNHGICPIEMFNGLLLFAGGAFAINGMEHIFKKEPIAQEIPTETIDTPTKTEEEPKVDAPE